jgi:hypothetical protein
MTRKGTGMQQGAQGGDRPLLIEADHGLDAAALRRRFAETMTEVTLSRLTVVFRNLARADEIPVDSLIFLSRRASDCEVLLEACHPEVLRLLESAPYRGHFHLVTAASPPAGAA